MGVDGQSWLAKMVAATNTGAWVVLLVLIALGLLLIIAERPITRLIGPTEYDSVAATGIIVTATVTIFLVGTIPGFIAEAKGYKHATAIRHLGYAGFLTLGILWLVALVLACAIKTDPEESPTWVDKVCWFFGLPV